MAGDGRLERYRLNAEKCLTLAQTFTNFENKRALLAMANAWLTLAEQLLKKSETVVCEVASPVNEPPPARVLPKPPPVGEPPSLSLDPAKPDDPMQC